MRTRIHGCVAFCAVLLGSGCAGKRAPSRQAPAEAAPEIVSREAFACADGTQLAVELDRSSGRLSVSRGDDLETLEPIPSDTGRKFSNGEVTFWSRGDQATLTVGEVAVECEKVVDQ